MVHADSARDPHRGDLALPIWPSHEERIEWKRAGTPAAYEERLDRARWVKQVHDRAAVGLGLGRRAHDPQSMPLVKSFEDLPDVFLRQRRMMQVIRARGFTTRASHGVDSALWAGMIAVQSGLSRYDIELATYATLFHDTGHFAFPHASESAIDEFYRATKPGYVPKSHNHATMSGLVIARFPWVDAPEDMVMEMRHGASNHSWQMRYGNRGRSAGIAADLAGLGDRLSYTITDYRDAVRAGRVAWDQLEKTVPWILDVAQISRSKLDAMLELGPEAGGAELHRLVRRALVLEAAQTFRDTGIVGLPLPAGQAVSQLRDAGADRLANFPKHKAVQAKQHALCLAVLHSLHENVLLQGHDETSAPDEAVRQFGELMEHQVVRYTYQHRLKLEVDGKPFQPSEALEVPFESPSLPSARPTTSDRRLPLKPLPQLVDVAVQVQTDAGLVALDAVEVVELMGVLANRGLDELAMTIDRGGRAIRVPIPTERSVREAWAQSAEEALRTGLQAAVAEFSPTDAAVPDPRRLDDERSLGLLVALYRANDADSSKTFAGYLERCHAAQRPVLADAYGTSPDSVAVLQELEL
jgi:hypothetical protein